MIKGFILYSPIETEPTGQHSRHGHEIFRCTKFKYFFRVYNRKPDGKIIDFVDQDLAPETEIEIIDDSTAFYEPEMWVSWSSRVLGKNPGTNERSANGSKGKLFFGDGKWLFVHNGKSYEWRCEEVEVLKFSEASAS